MSGDKRSEDGASPLEVLVGNWDGFVIAEADLQISGPGDFLGTSGYRLPLQRNSIPG